MKKSLAVIFMFMSGLMVAQNTVEKTIGEFKTLKVYDLIEVTMIKSNINKVVITGKNSEDVKVVNKNGKLKIKMNLEESFDGNNTSVSLYYTNIDVIDANEGASISSEDLIKQFEIDLNAQEGGQINVNLEVSYANIKSVTGGIIETTGTAKNQDISINTGGVYEAKTLETETTKVNIKAAGEAHVNASDLADIKIRLGGDVYIYGNPKVVNESRVIGGRVKRMD